MEDKITPIRKALLEKTKFRDNRKAQLQDIEDAHYIDIIEKAKDKDYAKDNNLTNDKGRSLALKEKLTYDEDYQLLTSAYEILSVEVESLNIELERERNAFKVWYVETMQEIKGI